MGSGIVAIVSMILPYNQTYLDLEYIRGRCSLKKTASGSGLLNLCNNGH